MNEDQVILIDKPSGMTSFGVVARVRRVMSQRLGKKAKVGHTGTLDPFATGLMIIVTGKECRNAGFYTKLDKVYEATIHFGVTSSTGDPEGELTSQSGTAAPSEAAVKEAMIRFTGDITQTPPIYSAIKINGQRAYDLARKGEVPDMPPRQVTVFSLDIVSYEYPILKVRTHVSSGTYIRTLAQDIGDALGTGAYCSQLRRTVIADHDIAQAQPLDEFMTA